MAVNQQRRVAIKRLKRDLEELQECPVASVSAAPLDSDMFEWHCCFLFDDTVYHVILFFPENYPFVSPSAEFVPKGFTFIGGGSSNGKKGTRICLSIFSDFAIHHPDWVNAKSFGWTPGYTVQTVLLNLVSTLVENIASYSGESGMNNVNLARNFTCKDCGHTHAKPFPVLDARPKVPMAAAKNEVDIVDYVSKLKFTSIKPKSRDLFGFGLIQSGSPTRPAFTSPCEYLTGASFFSMKSRVGHVHSIMKENLTFFLPMYINETHGGEIKALFEETMMAIAEVIPDCKCATIDDMTMKVIPSLLRSPFVDFSNGTQCVSDHHIQGYFALHRLFLWAVQTYPELQDKINTGVAKFINDPDLRTVDKCQHIGEWLMLLAASSQYRWKDAGEVFVSESWRRDVMWYVKDDVRLGRLNTDWAYRLDATLRATAVNRKLLAFQVLFLDIAMPEDMTRVQILRRYDQNNGVPTDQMVLQMKQAYEKVENMKTYADWFKVLKLPTPPDEEIVYRLINAVEFSINTDGYKITCEDDQGGWHWVLKTYKNGTAGAAGSSLTLAGKNKGQRKTTSELDVHDNKKEVKDNGCRKRLRSQNPGKNSAKKAKIMQPDAEEDMEVDPVPVKGRGLGRRRCQSRARGARGSRGR